MNIINFFKKLILRYPIDAGHWIRDHKSQRWIEKEFISQEYYDSYILKRNVVSNTEFIFYIDGFPRQGNTTLRTILLNTFPDMAMPDPLMHVVSLAEKAILDKKIIFYTIRNPHDSILSLMSMNIKQWPNHFILKSNRKNRIRIRKYINYYIRHCSFIKDNINNIVVIPFEEIVQISNDYLNDNIHNNHIIKNISHKYDLSINAHSDFLSFFVFTSSNKEVESLYLHTSYYRKKLKKADQLYEEIIKLVLEQELF